jgi:hypothetical protein
MRTDRAWTARLLAALVIPLVALGFARSAAAGATDSTVVAAFDEAEQALAGLPPGALGRLTRATLMWKLQRAESQYPPAGRSVDTLGGYLRQTQALREGPRTATAESLYNLGRLVLDLVLAGKPMGCTPPGVDADPDVRVMESDNRHLSADVLFGRPRLTSILRGEELWTRLWVPGVETQFGEPGLPAVPFFSTLVAVPHGAAVAVRGTPAVAESLRALYPVQNRPPWASRLPTASTTPPAEVSRTSRSRRATRLFHDLAVPATSAPWSRGDSSATCRWPVRCTRYNPGSDQPTSSARSGSTTFGAATGHSPGARGAFEPLASADAMRTARPSTGSWPASPSRSAVWARSW